MMREGDEIIKKKPSFDFYYSKKAEERYADNSDNMSFCIMYRSYVNGIIYTEMCEKGVKPIGRFDDHELVYTGNDHVITQGEQY